MARGSRGTPPGPSAPGPAHPAEERGAMTHRQVLVVIVGLMLVVLLAALDQTIVATALPRIVSELGGLRQYSWVVTAYLLASTATTPLYGKVSDLYGRKRIFQAAIVIFLFGSVLCGVSQGIWQLAGFRAVQGVGGGGLMALSMAVIGDVVPARQRGRYQGYFGAVFAMSSVVGPLIGGFLTDQVTWRWIFYVNIPLGVLAFAVLAAALHVPPVRYGHRIDYVGAALVVSGVIAIMLVAEWGGRTYPWTSTEVIGTVCGGLALLGVFLWWERRAVEPILPLRLFRDRVFTVATTLGLLSGVALFGVVIFLPQYLQVVKGASATKSGLLVLPLTMGIVVTSVASGRLITRTGRYRIYPILGTLVLTLGFSLLSRVGVGTSLRELSAWMLITGLGIGLFLQVVVLAVQNAVDVADLGTATSAIAFFRTLGGSVGTALFGAVLSGELHGNLVRLLPPSQSRGVDVTQVAGNVGAIRALPEPVRGLVLEAFARSFHVVYLVAIPFGVAAFVLALLLPERPLRDHPLPGARH
jgi:EmrB/QacA subfamily drug resistance transporter